MRRVSGLLLVGIALPFWSVPAWGQTDPCATLSAAPETLHYNANGGPVETFTVTAGSACFWFFQFLGGDSFVLAQPEQSGTVVFDPKTNPLQAAPNHLTHSLTEQFQVRSISALSTAASATITAIQDPAFSVSWTCPLVSSNPVIAGCNGHVGVPFSAQLLASGGLPPYTFSSDPNHFPSGLPPGLTNIGLSLDTSTGLISGTPTGSGTFALLVIYVKDAHGAIAGAAANITISGPTDCASIINNALRTQTSGDKICATFTPNQGLSLHAAAAACGFKDFDWIQQVLVQFDPSGFYAKNLNKAFDPAITGPVRLTSRRTPWHDPPQGGGYTPPAGTAAADNSYPFYYDPATELPNHEDGTQDPDECTLAASADHTLTFYDAPADACLPGGVLVGSALCRDPVLAPKATSQPRGSFGGYFTHLAGVKMDGTAADLGIGFTWVSTYNGTTGGAIIKKTYALPDGNGTGGVTILGVNQTTTLGSSGGPPGPPPPLAFGNACDGTFGGTFNGDLTISAGQSCTFTFGHINGNVQVNGGSLSLSAVLVSGNVEVDGGSFSLGPVTSVDGSFQARNLAAGAAPNQICGATVFGDVQYIDNGAPVQIGSSGSCAGNTIGGHLQLQNNSGANSIFGNSVADELHIQNNTGSTQVFHNTVQKILHCENNSSITGGGNTAQQKQGQCAAF
ncbi:MAG TPA: hypothetical protein VKX45_23225 [Bryobacteraceae bacterium]|nr:hypothetical protein [Bryobacteraceae bacterium]